jgi:hypothetical protein
MRITLLLSLTSLLISMPIFAKPNITKLGEKCSTGNHDACSKLVKIAINNEDSEMRRAAARVIKTPALLSEIALSAPGDFSEDSSWIAVQGLEDQQLLSEIAIRAKSSQASIAAAKKISDQLLLIEIIKNTKDLDVRIIAISKLTDQSFLQGIINNGTDVWSINAALRRLTNEQVLTEFALKSENSAEELNLNLFKEDLLGLLKFLQTSCCLTQYSKDMQIRLVALARISDQHLLAVIAGNAKYLQARKAALLRLTDQKGLAEVLKSSSDIDISKEALKKLTEQVLLADVAREAKHGEIRIAALNKITDNKIISDLAKSSTDPQIRELSLEILQLDEAPILAKKILAQGPGNRFVIGELFESNQFAIGSRDSIAILIYEEDPATKNVKRRSNISLRSIDLRTLSFVGNAPNITDLSDGDVVFFKGKVPLMGFAFNGNRDAMLSFVVLRRFGLIYLSGTGSVTLGDGKTINLSPELTK